MLARQLGVSRTPLREALRMLQREGLILSEPNRRVRIADFSIADAEEIYAMRIALECVAIRATIPQLTVRDFAELEGLMAQMEHYGRADDFTGMDIPHSDFHARLVAAAGPRLRTTLRQLFDHAQRYRRAYGAMEPEGYIERFAEHRAIVDAAAVGDVDGAVEALARHYLHTALHVIGRLEPAYEPEFLRATVASAAAGAIDVLNAGRSAEPVPSRSRRRSAPAPRHR